LIAVQAKELSISYKLHTRKDSISENDGLLLGKAIEATSNAYAPYSKFYVGVAIRTVDGDIVSGSNQENSSFPVGQCAERVALYRLTHELGRKPIDVIAIAVSNEHQTKPASPCGSCRQMLNEYRSFQDQPIRLLLGSVNCDEIIEINDVRDLLPFAFDGSFLGI
jgi:cytidine deaminase